MSLAEDQHRAEKGVVVETRDAEVQKTSERWSVRKAALFIVAISAGLWTAFILTVWLLISV